MKGFAREFNPEDADEVISLWKKVGIYYEKWDKKENLIKKHEIEPDLFIVYEKDGRILGTVMGMYDGWQSFIAHIAVDKEHRRKGIGKILMEEIEKRLVKRGAEAILVDSLLDNPYAGKFYGSLGYKKRAMLQNWEKDA